MGNKETTLSKETVPQNMANDKTTMKVEERTSDDDNSFFLKPVATIEKIAEADHVHHQEFIDDVLFKTATPNALLDASHNQQEKNLKMCASDSSNSPDKLHFSAVSNVSTFSSRDFPTVISVNENVISPMTASSVVPNISDDDLEESFGIPPASISSNDLVSTCIQIVDACIPSVNLEDTNLDTLPQAIAKDKEDLCGKHCRSGHELKEITPPYKVLDLLSLCVRSVSPQSEVSSLCDSTGKCYNFISIVKSNCTNIQCQEHFIVDTISNPSSLPFSATADIQFHTNQFCSQISCETVDKNEISISAGDKIVNLHPINLTDSAGNIFSSDIIVSKNSTRISHSKLEIEAEQSQPDNKANTVDNELIVPQHSEIALTSSINSTTIRESFKMYDDISHHITDTTILQNNTCISTVALSASETDAHLDTNLFNPGNTFESTPLAIVDEFNNADSKLITTTEMSLKNSIVKTNEISYTEGKNVIEEPCSELKSFKKQKFDNEDHFFCYENDLSLNDSAGTDFDSPLLNNINQKANCSYSLNTEVNFMSLNCNDFSNEQFDEIENTLKSKNQVSCENLPFFVSSAINDLSKKNFTQSAAVVENADSFLMPVELNTYIVESYMTENCDDNKEGPDISNLCSELSETEDCAFLDCIGRAHKVQHSDNQKTVFFHESENNFGSPVLTTSVLPVLFNADGILPYDDGSSNDIYETEINCSAIAQEVTNNLVTQNNEDYVSGIVTFFEKKEFLDGYSVLPISRDNLQSTNARCYEPKSNICVCNENKKHMADIGLPCEVFHKPSDCTIAMNMQNISKIFSENNFVPTTSNVDGRDLSHSVIMQEKEWLNRIDVLNEHKNHLLDQRKCLSGAYAEITNNLRECLNFLPKCMLKKKTQGSDDAKHQNEIIKERDQALEDFQNVEKAFSELMVRYEKTKAVLEQMKENDTFLKQKIDAISAEMLEQQQKYNFLQARAEEKLSLANEELLRIRKEKESEKAALTAMIRKAEIKSRSLSMTLEQTVTDNKELSRMCEEFSAKCNT